MKGTYCILARLPEDTTLRVGALGRISFQRGVYLYVGSALGGVERRIRGHAGGRKKMHWHIDYLLRKAEVVSVMAIASESKETECLVARTLSGCEGASLPVPGFGSSDCNCPSHLVYLGDVDPEMVAESVAMRLSMTQSAYPRTVGLTRTSE